MKVVDIESGKSVSPESVTDSLVENVNEIRHIIICYETKEGIIDFGWSDMDLSKRLFMLECAKQQVLKEAAGEI